MLDERLSRLIAKIYDGVHDGDAFDTAVEKLLDLANARFILVSCVDFRCREYDYTKFYGPDDGRFLDGVIEYKAEHYRSDPTLRHALLHPRDGHVSLRQTLAADHVAPADLAFARWVESQLGASDMHIRYTPPDDDLILGVSVHAKVGDGALTDEAKRLLAFAFPHIDNARRLVARPPDLDSDTEARLIVDRDRRVRAASPAAQVLLATADGLSITDGTLCGARQSENHRIAALIRSAAGTTTTGTAGGTIAVPRPSHKRAWIVRATSLPAACGPFQSFGPAAVLTIIDPDAGPPPSAAARWRAVFGFTPAETRLADALLAGDGNLRTAADRLGIAYATARVQLASVFDKVGVNSQAQLARLLTRIGGWVMALWPGVDQAASVWA